MATNDSEWWMFSYKVQPCPLQERHDWSTCPHAHRGERAARRCPRTYSYTPEACPDYSKTGVCPRGADCPLAHSVWESWLHPSRFRTQLCCFGPSCKRRICFFAHDPSQLRAATTTPGSAAAAAAVTSAPVMRRTQAVIPANLMMGYGGAGASAVARPNQQAGMQQSGSILASPGQVAALGAAPAGMQAPQMALQQQQEPQPQLLAGVPGPAWFYTAGGGWVQAGHPHMGHPAMLMPAGGGVQGPMQVLRVQGGPAGVSGVEGGPGHIVPAANQAMVSSLAAGLSGLTLQGEQPALTRTSSSVQGHACVPAVVHNSPSGAALQYQPARETYPMHAQAAAAPGVQVPPTVVYAPVLSPAAGLQPQTVLSPAAGLQPQQLQQQYLMSPGGPIG